jgi:putative lipoic acid-binding regulatory protein
MYLKAYLCSMDNNDKFDKLRELLNKENTWPIVYMFKFIVPASNQKIALIESKFSDEAIISHKESSNGKYFSITVKEVMLSADAIIEKYQEMGDIEGLITL